MSVTGKAFSLLVFAVLLSVSVMGQVELGPGVEINQPGNNASINITGSFNVSGLVVYRDATEFGGSNFSILQGTGDWVDIRLNLFDPDAGANQVVANFTGNTTQSNNVTFAFTDLFNSSLYEAYHNDSLVKREESSASGSFQFFNSFWVPAQYQDFRVENTDNVIPVFNQSLYRNDRRRGVKQLEFGIDDGGERDIENYTGTGSLVEFTNTSLILGVTPPISSNYTVTDVKSAVTSHEVVLEETDSGLGNYGTGNFSYQEVGRSILLNNTGSDSIDYNVALQNHGTVETQESWTGTLAGGSSVNHTGVWSGDWILNEQEFSTTYRGGEVVYGSGISKNYTAVQNVYAENNRSDFGLKIDFSRNLTDITGCQLSNSSVQELAAAFAGNVTFHKSCRAGEEFNYTPTQKIAVGDHFEYNYTATVEVFTNLTENRTQRYGIPETRLDNWNNRDPSQDQVFVDGSSQDVSIKSAAYGGTEYVLIEVGPNHGNSSLHSGKHKFTLTYSEGSGSNDGGSDGGSTGGSSGPVSVIENVTGPDYNWSLSVVGESETESQQIGILAAPGRIIEKRFRVTNQGEENVTLTVGCVSADGVCDWVQPTVDKIRLGTERFQSQDFYVRGRVPFDIAMDQAYRFSVRVTDPSMNDPENTGSDGEASADFQLTIVPIIGDFFAWFDNLMKNIGPFPVWVYAFLSGIVAWFFFDWSQSLFNRENRREWIAEALKFGGAIVVFIITSILL